MYLCGGEEGFPLRESAIASFIHILYHSGLSQQEQA